MNYIIVRISKEPTGHAQEFKTARGYETICCDGTKFDINAAYQRMISSFSFWFGRYDYLVEEAAQ